MRSEAESGAASMLANLELGLDSGGWGSLLDGS